MVGKLEGWRCCCAAVGLRVCLGFLPIFCASVCPKGQICFPLDKHTEQISFECFGEISLLISLLGDSWSQKVARWAAGRGRGVHEARGPGSHACLCLWCARGGQRTAYRNLLSPSTIWSVEIELRSSDFSASAFIH